MPQAKRKQSTTAAPPSSAMPYSIVDEVAPVSTRPPHPSLAWPMWVYVHHPRSWEIRDGRILPDLSKMPLKSGVNGTFRTDSGRYDLRGLRANLSRAGKQIIPHGVDAEGGHDSYVVQPYPGYHVDRWTTLYEGSDQVTRDERAYDDWRASLVQRGVVAPPSYGALRHMLEVRERTLPRLQAQAATHARVMPDLEARIKRIEGEIEIIRTALSETTEPGPGLAAGRPMTVEGL